MIYDCVVIGAGIAGASAAFEISENGANVLLVEAEAQPGYHSSGRSAALFTRNYGSALVRKINALSEPFLRSPSADFVDRPLLTPRGALAVAGASKEHDLDVVLSASTVSDPIIEIPVADALAMAPFLRPERVNRAVFEPGVMDIEAALLLQSYLKGFKNRGGQLKTSERVEALIHQNDFWLVSTNSNTYKAKTLVNAAGAWADEIGKLAGATHIGLVAKRRTAIIVDAPDIYETHKLPCTDFAGSDAYVKPDSGKLMISPGDATPITPQDVQPDELDVAILVDWIERETLIQVHRVSHSWAGLRSFVADDSPVVGYDSKVPDFIWHAGQGGYGIMMAPALAKFLAAIFLDNPLPSDFTACGITAKDLAPQRIAQINN